MLHPLEMKLCPYSIPLQLFIRLEQNHKSLYIEYHTVQIYASIHIYVYMCMYDMQTHSSENLLTPSCTGTKHMG